MISPEKSLRLIVAALLAIALACIVTGSFNDSSWLKNIGRYVAIIAVGLAFVPLVGFVVSSLFLSNGKKRESKGSESKESESKGSGLVDS